MNSVPSPTDNSATSFLAEDEEPKLSWGGVLLQGEDEKYPAQFVATNSRLVFSLGGGHFKDVGFKHIESVEVGTDIETDTEGIPPYAPSVIGGISGILGLILLIIGGGALSVITGLAMFGLAGYGFWYGYNNYDRLDENFDVQEYEVYHILLRTSATSPFSRPLYIETRENVGPDLSRLVQESE